mgnify:CR=1 FL=1
MQYAMWDTYLKSWVRTQGEIKIFTDQVQRVAYCDCRDAASEHDKAFKRITGRTIAKVYIAK